jgi:hypothetical protein
MSREVWDHLLIHARNAHRASAILSEFCAFPDDVSPQNVEYRHIPPADLMVAETWNAGEPFEELRNAFLVASPFAWWRLTYEGTNISQDFLDRFGCYALIGDNGAFHSEKSWSWVVYMPPGLYYPWHHHPGEEAYMVIAGQAEFMAEGEQNRILKPGDVSIHKSNQPHAMQTHDHPVMAMVTWRNGFDTAPVLTHGDAR